MSFFAKVNGSVKVKSDDKKLQNVVESFFAKQLYLQPNQTSTMTDMFILRAFFSHVQNRMVCRTVDDTMHRKAKEQKIADIRRYTLIPRDAIMGRINGKFQQNPF